MATPHVAGACPAFNDVDDVVPAEPGSVGDRRPALPAAPGWA